MSDTKTAICKHCDLPIRETHMGHVRNEWEHMDGLSFCAGKNHWAWPKEVEVTPPSPQPAAPQEISIPVENLRYVSPEYTQALAEKGMCLKGVVKESLTPVECCESENLMDWVNAYPEEVAEELLHLRAYVAASLPKPAPQTEQSFRSDEVLLREILSYNRRRSDNHPKFDIAIREACIKLQGFDPDAAKGTR